MIVLPKYSELGFSTVNKCKIGGRWKLKKGINDGYIDAHSGLWIPGKDIVTGGVDWFPNLITDYGLNASGTTGHWIGGSENIHVGTGTTAPSVLDTALETWVASTATRPYGLAVVTNADTPPYFSKAIQTLRFGEGVAEGNISEVGGSRGATNTNMWTRALVVDGGGSPTTISVSATEWLDVTYEHHLYPDHVLPNGGNDDGTGTIDISGTNYDYTIRPANLDNENFWDASTCLAAVQPVGLYNCRVGGSASTLGTVLAEPSSVTYYQGTNNTAAYSTDTFYRDNTLTLGLTDGNETGGIKTLLIYTYMGNYQIQLLATSGGTPVPKDGTKIFTYTYRMSWARATIT